MKKLLITGFDPFGGEAVNPAFEAVRLLPAVSSLQQACARLALPWHKVICLSLHGRDDLGPRIAAAGCLDVAGGVQHNAVEEIAVKEVVPHRDGAGVPLYLE